MSKLFFVKVETKYFILFVILIFFLVTRIYNIIEVPSSLYWDEASIAYNAYSFLQTGRDEWGEFLPLHFRAFGEFKLPVYIYTTALLESIIGMNELAIRLPAVIFSLGTLALTYLLSKKIFNKESIGLFSAFFLAISPWFFIFSRTGYEVSAGLMFFLLGIYSILHRPLNFIYYFLSLFSFILSMYSYNGFRIISPIALLLFAVYLFKTVKFDRSIKTKLWFPLALIIIILSVFPILNLTRSQGGLSRLQSVGIFSQTSNTEHVTVSFVKNYISHFSPEFLLIKGDKNLRSQIGTGQFYWLDIPLIIIGLVTILKKKNSLNFLPIVVILVGIIPAAITFESPHALRSLAVVPFVSMLLAVGADSVFRKLILKVKFNFLPALIVFIYMGFFLNYLSDFNNDYRIKSSSDWQYGYKEIFTQYRQQFTAFDKIIISDGYAQPYIFALYYLKFDPSLFRSEVNYNAPDKWGFSTVRSFDRFVFGKINLEGLPKGKSLVFASPEEKLKGLREKNIIKNLDNSVAFYVYEYENK